MEALKRSLRIQDKRKQRINEKMKGGKTLTIFMFSETILRGRFFQVRRTIE